ncbi:hypothetical protein AgCh_016579 [Apium graveolens]
MVAANEEVIRLTKINEKLENEKHETELLLMELEAVKQENTYLKNKLKCTNEIEAVLREKLEKNKVKRKKIGDKGKITENEDVPTMLKKVVSKSVEGACKYNEANANDPYSFGDKFDCIPCNMKVMKSCHKLMVDLKELIIRSTTTRENIQTSMNAILSETSNSTSAKLVNKKKEKAGPLVTFGDNNKGFTMGYGKIISGNVVIDDAALVAGLEASIEQSQLLHKKLSHLNYKAINTLVKKELVRDMPKLEFAQIEVCEACQKGKIKRSSHKPKTVNSISAPLQLIHMDLFGPVNDLSISRNRFALVMVDDFLRNATLSEFCKNKGIVQEFSAARTPEQNGIDERNNRTLVEAARTMLQDANLPTSFLEETFNTACYTQNKYLTNKFHGKSPYSILSKRNPTVKYLHVFGSKCYILKDNYAYMGKFDSKVFEAIFLGYSLERTAYKVYVIDQKKIMENTYMTFDDDKCPGLECLDDNEAEALTFENLNIDSDSDEEAEVNVQQMINEEITEQENYGNGRSYHTLDFDSTNSGGRKRRSTRSATANECRHACFLSQVEPKKTEEALMDPDWISAMQEELNQFERNKV